MTQGVWEKLRREMPWIRNKTAMHQRGRKCCERRGGYAQPGFLQRRLCKISGSFQRRHADGFTKIMAQWRTPRHSGDLDALLPQFPNKRNSAGRVVSRYVVADFFKIKLGERGKCALHGPSQGSLVSLLYFASSLSKTLSDGMPGPLSLPS